MSLIKVVFFVLILKILFCSPCYAISDIVVYGSGANRDEAIRDALRNAVEQVNGVFIMSETEVVNSQLLSDNISSTANGHIKSYEVLSSESKFGNLNVKVKVMIDDKEVERYIKRVFAKLDESGLDNDISLVKAKMENIKNRKELSDKAKKLIMKNGYYAEVAGYKIKEVKENEVTVEIEFILLRNKLTWDTYHKIQTFLNGESSVKYQISNSYGESYHFYINGKEIVGDIGLQLCKHQNKWGSDRETLTSFSLYNDTIICASEGIRYSGDTGYTDHKWSRVKISDEGSPIIITKVFNNPEMLRTIPEIKLTVGEYQYSELYRDRDEPKSSKPAKPTKNLDTDEY